MPDAQLHILGVRHHGPGSARTIVAALEHFKPDCVLIEGPPDAHEVLPLAAHAEMRPPVCAAGLRTGYAAERRLLPLRRVLAGVAGDPLGLREQSEVRFIDLPISLRDRFDADDDDKKEGSPDDAGNPPSPPGPRNPKPDPRLPRSPRRPRFERPASRTARLGGDGSSKNGAATRIRLEYSMRSARPWAKHAPQLGERRRDAEEPAREAHMRKCIRTATKEGFERIAVVCGAWHAPVLTAESIKSISAKTDDEILKPLKKRKTTATWIPWTHGRLTMASGYGAGVASPGWYEHLWIHHSHTAERWLTRVARLMRAEDLDASPAHVVEGVRLAESLAALRGRAIAGLEELGEATLSILCAGQPAPHAPDRAEADCRRAPGRGSRRGAERSAPARPRRAAEVTAPQALRR